MRTRLLAILTFALALAPLRAAEQRGVIDDFAGSAEVRASENAESAVVATVKSGEPFIFQCEEEADWCAVTLDSGKNGWLERRRIRFHFTEKDLPADEPDPEGISEIDEVARRLGFNYARTTLRAARGDAKALKQFFALTEAADGAASESLVSIPFTLYHVLGDEKFAKFLAAQPLPYRAKVRNTILSDGRPNPDIEYLQLHFPRTSKILFGKEVVGWISPNKRYAIRKVFSDEFDLARATVERAEVIDQKDGRVLCDLTRDDIGIGAQREGEVLWSPDSKRFAYLSSDLTVYPGNLFSTPRPPPQRKQTAVYQVNGDAFARVDLPLSDIPGRAEDTELKNAILGHEFTEPLRWAKPNVLVLQRHEYYQTLKPTVVGDQTFDSIHDLSRQYEITATIPPDGPARIVWKQRKD